MTEASRNFLVGGFVIVALCVLGTLMVWFGEVPDWISTSEWTLRIGPVRELSGIGEGAPVNLQGIQVGRVKSIEFRNPDDPDHGVVIVTRIKQQYSVPTAAKARVYGSTLGFGSGRIDIMIEPGASSDPLPKDDAVIGGEMRNVLGEIIRKEFIDSLEKTVAHIGDLAEATKPVMDSLAELFERRSIEQVSQPGAVEMGMIANLSTLVERVDKSVSNINNVLGDEDVQDDVKSAVHDLRVSADDLRATVETWRTESKRLADNLNEGVDRTEENLDETFQSLNRVLGNLDQTATQLAKASIGLTERSGTAGLVLNDPRLYESAVLAMDRLSEVLLDIKSLTGKMRDDGYITVGLAPGGFPKKKFPVPASGEANADDHPDESRAFDLAVQEAREPATLGSFPP